MELRHRRRRRAWNSTEHDTAKKPKNDRVEKKNSRIDRQLKWSDWKGAATAAAADAICSVVDQTREVSELPDAAAYCRATLMQNESAWWSLINEKWWKFLFSFEWLSRAAADAYQIEECQSHARAITKSEERENWISVEILNSRERESNVEDNLLWVSFENNFPRNSIESSNREYCWLLLVVPVVEWEHFLLVWKSVTRISNQFLISWYVTVAHVVILKHNSYPIIQRDFDQCQWANHPV